jgi:UDP-glucose:(heptosyl)LPS alpha-1,3-glucosyltransferase
MRIGIAHIEYSRRKGIERHSAELADRIAARGHEVHFHCAECIDTSPSRIIFHRVPMLNIVNSTRILSYAMLGPKGLKLGRYDLTHSHGSIVGCDIITAHSCHRAGMDIRRRFKKNMVGGKMNFGLADRIRLAIEHENCGKRRYKKVIAVSEGVKRELVRYYEVPEQDIVVIPNGVDLDEFNPTNRLRFREPLRENLGILPFAPVLIFVANEFDRKGLGVIIKALPLLKIPELRLLVLGGDNRFPYLGLARKLGVDSQILFLGNVQQISRYYAASDLFVLPTFYEAFSVATLEAAATGLPLLVTKVNGTEELVQGGYNGYFVDRNPESIAGKLQILLSDTGELRKLGANARKSAEPYSWDSIAERTLSVYEEIRHWKSS